MHRQQRRAKHEIALCVEDISSAALAENPICLWQKCQNQNIHHTFAFVPAHSLRRRALALGLGRKEGVCMLIFWATQQKALGK